jgi:methylated-DNA-protein-cysteine methyltransferase-like protein
MEQQWGRRMTSARDESRGFWDLVYERVREVPAGRVVTYGQVAAAVGSPRAARQVGFALAGLRVRPEDADVPWHRVINREGRISGRGEVARAEQQRALLEAEGVLFDGTDKCDLRQLRFRFRTAGDDMA